GDEDALDADRGLDHERDVTLAVWADVFELRRRVFRVPRQVVVTAVRDALELRPADRIEVLDVARRARVVRALILAVLARTEVVATDAVAHVPAEPLVEPVAVPLVGLGGRDEVRHLHLLELAHAEEEVAGRDLVAKRLSDLGDAERRLAARDLQHVLEVDEDPLRRLGAQVRARSLFLDGPD